MVLESRLKSVGLFASSHALGYGERHRLKPGLQTPTTDPDILQTRLRDLKS